MQGEEPCASDECDCCRDWKAAMETLAERWRGELQRERAAREAAEKEQAEDEAAHIAHETELRTRMAAAEQRLREVEGETDKGQPCGCVYAPPSGEGTAAVLSECQGHRDLHAEYWKATEERDAALSESSALRGALTKLAEEWEQQTGPEYAEDAALKECLRELRSLLDTGERGDDR